VIASSPSQQGGGRFQDRNSRKGKRKQQKPRKCCWGGGQGSLTSELARVVGWQRVRAGSVERDGSLLKSPRGDSLTSLLPLSPEKNRHLGRTSYRNYLGPRVWRNPWAVQGVRQEMPEPLPPPMSTPCLEGWKKKKAHLGGGTTGLGNMGTVTLLRAGTTKDWENQGPS